MSMGTAARLWLVIAGLGGATAIGMGAYGAHGFDDAPEYLRDSFNIGVQYQMWHALALIGVAWMCDRSDQRIAMLAGIAITFGAVLFCGTLYAFGLTGDLPMRGLAPVGGYSLIAGWLLLALSALRAR